MGRPGIHEDGQTGLANDCANQTPRVEWLPCGPFGSAKGRRCCQCFCKPRRMEFQCRLVVQVLGGVRQTACFAAEKISTQHKSASSFADAVIAMRPVTSLNVRR